MSETKWTAPPWAVSKHAHGVFGATRGKGMEPIGFVYQPGAFEDSAVTKRADADARLISAAPELYSALADMVKAAELEDWDGRSKEYTAAVSALAKARGEQP
ncbi:hypothetical protein NG831_06345 [Xanthomonas sacchari]|nr:hypothetical protein [Xanthomonas sacchari]UYK67779.1 hypothetical protein NG831_06345 [Xanthomonas sacchari]